MFKFHKLAIQNMKPQHAKTLLITLIGLVILFVLAFVSVIPVSAAIQTLVLSLMMQQITGKVIALIALAILLPILLYIFIGYPLIAGIIHAIRKAINKEKVSFSDIIASFRKGRYAKSLKLSLFTLLFLVILGVITYIVVQLANLGVSHLFSAIQARLATSEHFIGYALTLNVILVLILAFIQSIITWFFTIVIVNYTKAYTEDPRRGAWKDVKLGFKGIKNGNKTWFKFFIGILLLNLIVLILDGPVNQALVISTGGISQTVATILINIFMVIVVIVRILIYYFNIIAVVQYFNRNGRLNGSDNTTSAQPSVGPSNIQSSGLNAEDYATPSNDETSHHQTESNVDESQVTESDRDTTKSDEPKQ